MALSISSLASFNLDCTSQSAMSPYKKKSANVRTPSTRIWISYGSTTSLSSCWKTCMCCLADSSFWEASSSLECLIILIKNPPPTRSAIPQSEAHFKLCLASLSAESARFPAMIASLISTTVSFSFSLHINNSFLFAAASCSCSRCEKYLCCQKRI